MMCFNNCLSDLRYFFYSMIKTVLDLFKRNFHLDTSEMLSLEKHTIMSKPRELFDEREQLEKLSRKKNPMEQLKAHIDFEYFHKPLEAFLDKDIDRRRTPC